MITLSIIGGFALWLLGAVLVWEWIRGQDAADELTASTWFLWLPFVLAYCVLAYCVGLAHDAIAYSVRLAHRHTFGRWRR